MMCPMYAGQAAHDSCKPVLRANVEGQQQQQQQPQQQQTCAQQHAHIADNRSYGSGTTIQDDFFPEGMTWMPLCSICLQPQCTDSEKSANRAQPGAYLLGVLVTVVDEVAGQFVFRPYGTPGRIQGPMTLTIMDKLNKAKLLTAACQERWLTLLGLWQKVGWESDSLVDFADTLRPLQYRDDLDEDFILSVTKEYLIQYIADLYTKQGFVMVMRSDVEDFVDIVDQHFSHSGAILRPADDAVNRLHGLEI